MTIKFNDWWNTVSYWRDVRFTRGEVLLASVLSAIAGSIVTTVVIRIVI